jgi:hypothetical protein
LDIFHEIKSALISNVLSIFLQAEILGVIRSLTLYLPCHARIPARIGPYNQIDIVFFMEAEGFGFTVQNVFCACMSVELDTITSVQVKMVPLVTNW